MRPKHVLSLAFASLLLSVGLVGSFAFAQPPQPAGGPSAAAPAGGPSGTTPAEPGQLTDSDRARRAKVIVKVGDTNITVGQVEDAVNAQSAFLRTRYTDHEKLREFVGNMVRFELLAREARRRDLQDLPEVERAMKQQAVQVLMRREFDERITPESIPEEEVRRYFDEHQDEFHRPAVVRASHILVDTREKALDLIKQARAGDMREFRRLARQNSDDIETKLRGGDLRFFREDGTRIGSPDVPVDSAIATAAFALRENGDVTPQPIPVGDKFSIVMRTARRDEENRSFEQAQQGIRLRIWRDARRRAVDEFVRGLHTRFQPEVFRDRIEWIHLDPPTGDEQGGALGQEQEADPLDIGGARPAREEGASPPSDEGESEDEEGAEPPAE